MQKNELSQAVDIVKFLTLETHCDPTSRNAGNVTALHVSAIKGHLDVLRFFTIDRNCDPNLAGQYGQAPLHYAATFGHLHIVKYLIDEEGCNPSCLDDISSLLFTVPAQMDTQTL